MIAEFESHILALIDDMIEHVSDDELFASGYLCGYPTLAVAELDTGKDHSAEVLYANVTSGLERAISAGELPPCGQASAKEMWDILFQKATQ